MDHNLLAPTLEEIYLAGLKFLEPQTSEETYATIVQEAVKLVNGDDGQIFLDEEGEYKLIYATPGNQKLPKNVRKGGYIHKSFISPQAFLIQNHAGVRSSLFMPLSYRRKSIGVLVIYSNKTDRFSGKDLDVLKLFGSMATLGIRKTQLYDDAQHALEVRDKFISMAAHELRTPLTSVSGYIQLLHSRLSGEDTVESRWVEQLLWESQRLTTLVSELLEINRIRSGQLEYVWKECHVREIIARSIKTTKMIYPDRQVILTDLLGEVSDVVVGDFDKLLQVLSNVIDNAIKFSPADSPIVIRILNQTSFLVIEVKDQGVGIPKKDSIKVFEEFYKGVTNLKGGMGLGLSIAKTIVSEHRGQIISRSKNKLGTTMIVKLPKVQS